MSLFSDPDANGSDRVIPSEDVLLPEIVRELEEAQAALKLLRADAKRDRSHIFYEADSTCDNTSFVGDLTASRDELAREVLLRMVNRHADDIFEGAIAYVRALVQSKIRQAEKRMAALKCDDPKESK